MKQRFSSLDVKVIAHELSEALVSLRLSNIYDLNSKILLLKFAKPDSRQQLLIESGFRCHLTDFARAAAPAPSQFVSRLRKFLKTRRLTSVSQVGTDRIIEFQFRDGAYRLYLEFFAGGNIILTDAELKIIALLRNVPEGEGQEPQRVGLTYTLENRQNVAGVPDLTKERLRNALKKASDQAVAHVFRLTNFDPATKLPDILENTTLFDALFQALEQARSILDGVTSSPTSKGYIIAKPNPRAVKQSAVDEGAQKDKPRNLLYEDFQPFLPKQFEDDPGCQVLTFDGYNKTVDEFFSSLEGQKLESRLQEREATAKRKLDAARRDQAQRIDGLQEAQVLNLRKAAAIEANIERVQEAMDAINGLLTHGMDWVDVNKLVEREQKQHNPVAEIIKLPMRLEESTITLLLGEEEDEAEAEEKLNFDYDSDEETEDEPAAEKAKGPDKRLYYDQKRTAADKQVKTVQQSEIALKNAEQKIAEDLRKGLKQEKPVLQPIRKQMWFEKFTWFISSDGYLVLGGRDAQQNEMLYKRYLRKGDVYVHADMHGAASVIIKNNPKTPDAPIPPSTLAQAGNLSVCCSNAWDSKAAMGAWWVNADQVSKSAPAGEYLPVGSFMVRGKKNYLPPALLMLGFGLMFKISEDSKARHVKHRLYDSVDISTTGAASVCAATEAAEGMASPREPFSDSSDDEGDEEDDERANPLQVKAGDREDVLEPAPEEDVEPPTEELADLTLQPKRGQRGKAKKIAAKYKHQDDEDRALMEELLGVAAARQKAEAEAAAKAQREADAAAALARRRHAQERAKKQIAEHEEVRRVMMLEDGGDDDAEGGMMELGPLDALVGTPLPGDEVVEVVPVCAPWNALGKVKYKAKMQPGQMKKGKAVKEIVEREDGEKMWPREVELIKGLKVEEAFNAVPVGKVTVMMSGDAGWRWWGSGGKGGKGSVGKGGGGGQKGRGKKK
ncbi:hypothetical protein N0V88_003704 [Collariella sp. IMI 366227]|nr:hypothetical protein N0V88_003704 [Collariella sp. IMI 366227]